MASVPTIEVCKEDGSCRRRINEAQFGEYEQRGYRHLNPADALSDTEDTHPNGKDPIDPPMKIPSAPDGEPFMEPLGTGGDTSAEFPVGSGSPEDETIGKPSAFTD